jgi:hypothetical protein
MGEAVVGGRGDEDRVRAAASEQRRPRVALGDVDEDARTDRDPPPGPDVVVQGQLVAGAAGVVAVRPRFQDRGGALLEVGDRPGLGLDAGNLSRRQELSDGGVRL